MTLHERVRARLDEIEADCERTWLTATGARFRLARWGLDVWLPSLRRRAERHAPHPCCLGCCTRCTTCVGDDGLAPPYPCLELRDLCAEIGIDPDDHDTAHGGT